MDTEFVINDSIVESSIEINELIEMRQLVHKKIFQGIAGPEDFKDLKIATKKLSELGVLKPIPESLESKWAW